MSSFFYAYDFLAKNFYRFLMCKKDDTQRRVLECLKVLQPLIKLNHNDYTILKVILKLIIDNKGNQFKTSF